MGAGRNRGHCRNKGNDYYWINDFRTLYGLMGREDKFVAAKEGPIRKKIEALYKQREDVLESDQNNALERKIEDLNKYINLTARVSRYFSDYFDHKKEVQEFEDKFFFANVGTSIVLD